MNSLIIKKLVLGILLITGIFIDNSCFGQTIKTTREVRTLLSEQSIYLNGTANGALGGKSRTDFKIDLPPNTIEWYYVYSTSKSEAGNKTLNLISQLSNLIDPSGMTSIAASAIATPSGEALIDIYTLDRNGKSQFYEKDIFGAWTYIGFNGYPEGKMENAKNGTKKIDDVRSGTVFLGLKNPSTYDGVNVTIAVAAIIEVKVNDMSEWSTENKTKIFENCKKYLVSNGTSENAATEMANCVVNQMTTNYLPSDFEKLSNAESLDIQNKYYQTCYETINGGAKTEEQEKGVTYGNLGWKAYENGELEKAIEYSKKALLKDNTLGYVQANLGLFFLLKNDESIATDYYIDAISNIKKNKINAKQQFKAVIDDLNSAINKYPDLRGYKEILQLLQDEYDRN